MIKPTVTGSGLGFDCQKAKPRTGAFIKDILDCLNRADVVIADLTDKNPNVFYELGIRHTLKNRTILITQNIKHVPSDLRSYWVVTYRKDLTGANEFKKRVRVILREMQKNPEKPDSPVADFLQLKNIDILAFEKSANWKKIDALLSELSENLDHMDRVLEEAANNQKLRKEKRKEEIKYSVVRFDTTCLDLLNSTYYISLPENVIRLSLKVREFLKISNTRLDCWATASADIDIEKSIVEFFPILKNDIISLTKDISTIRIAYINDNYIEPGIPPPIFKRPEHQEYIKSS